MSWFLFRNEKHNNLKMCRGL